MVLQAEWNSTTHEEDQKSGQPKHQAGKARGMVLH